ncbi:SLC13 family permease, partial [Cellulomonas algicola]|uniref:SLC13 family permease n=1 Tax=Cellulomonas algicola TaxID=2071633 RepID=UPI001F3F1193
MSDATVSLLVLAGCVGLLAAIFLLTLLLGLVVSNTATVLIVVPIAVAMADEAGVPLAPVLMLVAVAGAASFLTPIATPANLMVTGPHGDRAGRLQVLGLLEARAGHDRGVVRGRHRAHSRHLEGMSRARCQSCRDVPLPGCARAARPARRGTAAGCPGVATTLARTWVAATLSPRTRRRLARAIAIRPTPTTITRPRFDPPRWSSRARPITNGKTTCPAASAMTKSNDSVTRAVALQHLPHASGLGVLTTTVVDVARDLRVEWELSRNPARINGGLSCLTLMP